MKLIQFKLRRQGEGYPSSALINLGRQQADNDKGITGHYLGWWFRGVYRVMGYRIWMNIGILFYLNKKEPGKRWTWKRYDFQPFKYKG